MKALLIIDVQQGLSRRKELYGKEQMLAAIKAKLSEYRQAGHLIVFIQHNNKLLPTNSSDWEIDAALPVMQDDIIIQKKHGNAFKNTTLDLTLKQNNISEITACGLTTHGCVKYTCLAALEHGYKVSLLKNGHSNLLKHAKAKITDTEKELIHSGITILQ